MSNKNNSKATCNVCAYSTNLRIKKKNYKNCTHNKQQRDRGFFFA